jgi:hypothetical protein
MSKLILSPITVSGYVSYCDGYAMIYFKHSLGRGEREGAGWVVREGVGAGGRNDPSLVCTYE